jgi:hypothetical protein
MSVDPFFSENCLIALTRDGCGGLDVSQSVWAEKSGAILAGVPAFN